MASRPPGVVITTGATGGQPLPVSKPQAPMNTGQTSAGSAGTSATATKEYSVRVQRDVRKRYCIMKFNAASKVDFTQCGTVKVERENNVRSFKAAHDIDLMPKFGAGSEFGREQKEEARRKKYGMAIRKYNPYEQPWLLKVGTGKQAKKYKGTKEGGILENTSYFVFTQCADGAFEACPVEEWYQFNPTIKYRYLNSEEAEEEFQRRDRNLNYRTLMLKKRLKGDDAELDGDDEEGPKKGKGKRKKEFKLTEMDEWGDLSDESENSEDGDGSDNGEKKAKKAKKPAKKKSKNHKANSDDEAVEESDDQDEGMEVDYMTSSDSDDELMFDDKQRDQDKYEEKGVAEEKGLLTLIDSDAEDEDDEEKKENPDGEGDGDEKDETKKKDGQESDSDSSSSDSDSDPEKEVNAHSALFMTKKAERIAERKKGKRRPSASSDGSAATNSRSATPSVDVEGKTEDSNGPASKKARVETPTLPGTSDAISEEAVRRYLQRKPMTTKDLLQKFKSKNTGLSKDKLVTTIAQILKKINPDKQKIKDKLYLSIKKD